MGFAPCAGAIRGRMSMWDSVCGLLAGVLVAGTLAGCTGKVDLGRDVFVGEWSCSGDKTLDLSISTIKSGDTSEKVAWIETGKNADYGLFTTKGARYSIFDQQQNSMTWHAHESGETLACTRSG